MVIKMAKEEKNEELNDCDERRPERFYFIIIIFYL